MFELSIRDLLLLIWRTVDQSLVPPHCPEFSRSLYPTSCLTFVRIITFILLLSLHTEKVWVQLMLCCVSHHAQKALDMSSEGGLVQLDFSKAFERVTHAGLL